MSFNKKFFTTGGIVASSAAVVPTNTDNFDIVTYTGNGSTQSITSLDFQPDFVWIKDRGVSGANHVLSDSVRGTGKFLISNSTDSEYTSAGGTLSSFDSNGFTLAAPPPAYDFNINGNSYVAWCWKASDTTVTDSSTGDITADIRANQDAGFSIVKYSGDNNASSRVPHGLSQAPEMIILKNLSTSYNWTVSHIGLNNDKVLFLEDAVEEQSTGHTAGTIEAQENHTATTFGFATGSGSYPLGGVNYTGYDCVAYCFHSVDGYQKIGSYSGASGRATISGLGFKPRFVMIKNITETGTNWHLFDNQRNTITDKLNNYLYANSSAIESGASTFAIFVGDTQTSPVTDYNDGFQVAAVNDKQINLTGDTFIYLAIA